MRHFTFLIAGCLWWTLASAVQAAPFELRDGDRVILLGDTLIEREQYHGYIELALTTRFPDRHVTFRNLGWSADTPAGASRFGLSLMQAGLEPPDEGWKQLREQIRQARPTVAMLGYGMASSFEGPAGLEQFRSDMTRLMDSIQELSSPQRVRFVILSPVPPLNKPNGVTAASNLAPYAQALRDLAVQRDAVFISLIEGLRQGKADVPLSENGIHLNAAGYQAAAKLIERGLGWPAGAWPANPQAERLRQTILKKNELFFHRSRPANMAYIFGFRKREQGKNAVEIPQFDPLIEAEERKIALLRSLKPVDLPAEPPPRTKAAAAKFTPQPQPSFQVAPELEVTLWAENPLLHKPVQMNFDPEGRLWIASSEVYPQVEPGQTADDKVLILEDSDGDGKADKSIVFADGLLIPTGLAPGDGGVYVAQSTELLHFRDTNGDGKADVRRIVLSGFGTEDTHHNLHTLRWGPDGRLYMNQSIYTRTDTETPHGVVRLKSGGIMRLDTQALRMNILFRGFWNSWGHQFDQFGQSFLTDGAGNSGINYGLPGATYVGYARARRVLDGISPGSYPKFCSLEIIESQHFPPDWQGDMITCDFRANRVVRFRVTEEGAGYVAQEVGDVLRSKEVSFRPIDVQLGPDGALYVADWSNPIINHGEVDFRDPRRDREHGRIWRITCKGRPLNPRRPLATVPTPALFDSLASPNRYDRAQAQRVLIERGPGVLKELDAWLARQDTEKALLEALWVKHAFDKPDPQLLEKLMRGAKDGRTRAAAVRVLGEQATEITGALSLLTQCLEDEHPRVRLEAVRALARFSSAEAADHALQVLEKPMDRFLDYGLWLTLNELAEPWLAAIAGGAVRSAGRDKALAFGLAAVPPEKATKALAALLEKRPITRDGSGPWIELVGQAGSPVELRRMLDQALQKNLNEPATVRALNALRDAARLRGLRPSGDLQPLTSMLEADNDSIKAAAVLLAGQWKLETGVPRIAALAVDRTAPSAIRTAACEALREVKGPTAIAGLRTVAANAQDTIAIRRLATVALAAIDPDASWPMVAAALRSADSLDADDFWRSLLGLAGMNRRISESLRKEPLPRAAAVVGLRVARENSEGQQELVRLLAQQAGLPEPKVYTAGELKQLSLRARLQGDPARGELVYRRADLKCVNCHAIAGAGGKVGPDLTSIGAGAPLDYLVESILLPNRKIKEGFHAIVLLTVDGRIVTGVPVRETAQETVLRDANDKEIAVPQNAVEERHSASSLMPANLTDSLSEQERLDLFRFLSELGRPGPFDATKSHAPRAWRILKTNEIDAKDAARVQKGEQGLSGWSSLTTTVAGALLKAEVEALAPMGGAAKKVYVTTRFEMPRAGTATFSGNVPKGHAAWIDGKPVAFGSELTLDLPAGTHALVVELDAGTLPPAFLVQSRNVVFLPDP